ncbi:MAG: aminoacyl-tRNA hydrolase [Planctomycetota bacterium]
MKRDRVAERRPALIVGLGNPGTRYHKTRHNLGFEIVDRLVSGLAATHHERLAGSDLYRTRSAGISVGLLKPGKYMNLSGGPTLQAVTQLEIDPDRVLVVHDDLDLELGRLRLRSGGKSGGHRGIEDIIRALGRANFPRLRIGIGRGASQDNDDADVGDDPDRRLRRQPIEQFVLEKFAPSEEGVMAVAVERATEAALCWLRQGLQVAMDRYNSAASSKGDALPPVPDGAS